MFEYIFFDEFLRDRFVSHARERGVDCVISDDPLGHTVAIPEELQEELLAELERHYDMLEQEQIALSRNQGDLKSLAGISFSLPDGESRMLSMQIEMANRLLASFSLEEIQQLFSDVARSALHPSEEHLCCVLRKKDQRD